MSNIKDNKFNAFACNKATRQESKQNTIDDDFKYILKRITEKRKMELEYKHFMARYDLEDLLGDLDVSLTKRDWLKNLIFLSPTQK